jgi:hypothetical protein
MPTPTIPATSTPATTAHVGQLRGSLIPREPGAGAPSPGGLTVPSSGGTGDEVHFNIGPADGDKYIRRPGVGNDLGLAGRPFPNRPAGERLTNIS